MKIDDEELLLMCINYLKNALNNALCENGSTLDTIELSNELDKLIVEYMRLKDNI